LTKLLVASYKENIKITTSEIISLDSTTELCSSLPNFPVAMLPIAGHLYNGTDPIICGSLRYESCIDVCFLFENGSWSEIPHLRLCRKGFSMSSIMHQNHYKLIMAGGYDNILLHFSTIEYLVGKIWTIEKKFQLPEAIAFHCLVTLSNSLLMLIGGETLINTTYTSIKKTWFFDTLNNNWTEGPDLITSRYAHSCGVMNWLNPDTEMLEKVVVVAGGYDGKDDLTSVELLFLNGYDLFQDGWVKGPVLPYGNVGSSLIEYQNGLIIVGGWAYRHLYYLSSPSETWVKMKHLLKEPEENPVALLIPDSLINCVSK
jgi:hypothetical protein